MKTASVLSALSALLLASALAAEEPAYLYPQSEPLRKVSPTPRPAA
jgi:hypothetical protein